MNSCGDLFLLHFRLLRFLYRPVRTRRANSKITVKHFLSLFAIDDYFVAITLISRLFFSILELKSQLLPCGYMFGSGL